jgi:hypothetical protein
LKPAVCLSPMRILTTRNSTANFQVRLKVTKGKTDSSLFFVQSSDGKLLIYDAISALCSLENDNAKTDNSRHHTVNGNKHLKFDGISVISGRGYNCHCTHINIKPQHCGRVWTVQTVTVFEARSTRHASFSSSQRPPRVPSLSYVGSGCLFNKPRKFSYEPPSCAIKRLLLTCR